MTYLATFHTHFGAMSFSRKLKKQGIANEMMPTPRALSASCGVCVRFACESVQELYGSVDIDSIFEEADGNHSLHKSFN